LFKGSSYITRDSQFDEVFELPVVINIQDYPKEIIFSKLEGKPNPPTVNITINSGGLAQVITINEVGRINLEL
jgi:hypothetical protein